MIKGKQSLAFEQTPYLTCAASVAGKKEGEGPLGALFDYVEKEDLFGENSWEAAEGAMQKDGLLAGPSEGSSEIRGRPVSCLEEIFSDREPPHLMGVEELADPDVRPVRRLLHGRAKPWRLPP